MLFYLKDYKQAIHSFELCLIIAKEMGDRVKEGQMHDDLGKCYFNLKDYKQEIQYYELSLSIAKETGTSYLERRAYKKNEGLL